MSTRNSRNPFFTRRELLKGLAASPLLFRPAPVFGLPFPVPAEPLKTGNPGRLNDIRLIPDYPSPSPLADILRLVPPGSDNYPTEKYAVEIETQLRSWGQSLTASPANAAMPAHWITPSVQAGSLTPSSEVPLRRGFGVEAFRREFSSSLQSGRERLLQQIATWIAPFSSVRTAEFEIYGIGQIAGSPLAVRADIRYDLAGQRHDGRQEERVGHWHTEWIRTTADAWAARLWCSGSEVVSLVREPVFVDVTEPALHSVPCYRDQLLRGVDYWRTVLDGACGIDIYNNTGVATGDYDNDGFDDIYICEPAGLPNRLFRNRGDGTFEDVTARAGLDILDNTACALFADFRNSGLQDLLVVCAAGPLLFLNQGNGKFAQKRDAFRFTRPPQGSFTHAAAADYDGDGRLDLYLCTYMYYLGLDQYHYPVPYYDAHNGPPNLLMHNLGDGSFVEATEAAGLDTQNNRYSFACAWGDSTGTGHPDLFIANDFGTSQLYRNKGDGTFTDASRLAQVRNVGAGMSCAWSDYDNSGRMGVYVASMWEAAGQRVSEQKQFHPEAPPNIRALYQRHARGNALYRNLGNGTFENVGHDAGVEMGRWSWCSDFWDFDHDGYADLYVANGYISGPDRDDLASFFWRQVVAQSPDDATPSPPYERGWNAINELVRSDHSWHGYARNVMFANNRNGTFSQVSAPAGLDFRDDSRAFALADLDHDGRLEVILKNRNAPQLRILHNALKEAGDSIVFRLRGQTSNRDAIGSCMTVVAGDLRQTKYLQAGSGFLAQHSKELLFGVGKGLRTVQATIRWPGGLIQHFDHLPVNHRVTLEEGAATFTSAPFAATPNSWTRSGPPPLPEPLPSRAGTWLLEPLTAPAFSAPDIHGTPTTLQRSRGSYTLLYFWAGSNPSCRSQLRLFQQNLPKLRAAGLAILAVNVDEPGDQPAARTLVEQEGLTYPAIFASSETAGIYNIIYRYLFDRRRNLGIPTSFLVDPDGRIIRVYQGPVATSDFLDDLRSAPANQAERLRRALPFPGRFLLGTPQRNDFTYGAAMFQHGYLDQAEISFKEVLARKPDDPDAAYNLGTLSLRRGDLAQARQYLQRTVRLRPNYPEAWNNLGMIAAQQDQPAEAADDFQQALLLRPGYAIAMLNLGNLYRREGDLAGAEDYLRKAAIARPDDPEVNYTLGMFYAEQNRNPQASHFLRKAIALRPDYPQALNNLGVLLVHTQHYREAEEEFRTCIRRVPDFDQSYLNLASLYAMQGHSLQAQEVLKQLLRIQPGNGNAQQALQMLQSAR